MYRYSTLKTLMAAAVFTIAGVPLHAIAQDTSAETGIHAGLDVENPVEPKFVLVDENADGVVSEEEYQTKLHKDNDLDNFHDLDLDDDGSLDQDEFDLMVTKEKTVIKEQTYN